MRGTHRVFSRRKIIGVPSPVDFQQAHSFRAWIRVQTHPITLDEGLAATVSRPVSELLGSLHDGYRAWQASHVGPTLPLARLLPTFGLSQEELRVDPWEVSDDLPEGVKKDYE